LQRGQHKAFFRVVWSNRLDPNESQAGIEALDFERDIWGVELPPAKVVQAASVSEERPQMIATPTAVAMPKVPAKSATREWRGGRVNERWGFRLALAFVGLFAACAIYWQIPSRYGRLEIQAQVPSVPSDRDLAPPNPKPHLPTLLARTLSSSVQRVQVAEAPLGHIVYPEPPADGVKGQVRLKVIIAANGIVKQIQALSGNPSLAEAAARAVHLWRYSSFSGSNQIAERETTVTVNFVGADAVSLEFPSQNAQLRTN
jgi:hypothetical protein